MTLLLAAVAVLVGATAQSISGIGFALVCGPLLVAVAGPDEGVPLAVALGALLNTSVLLRHRSDLEPRRLLPLLLPALVAVPLFAAGVTRLPARGAEALAGGCAILGAALLAAGLRSRRLAGRGGAVLASVASSGMQVVAGIGGPTTALYTVNAGWPAAAARSTLQAWFLALNLLTLVVLGLPDAAVATIATCVVAMLAGSWLGGRLVSRVTEAAARRTTLGLAATWGTPGWSC